MELVGWHRDWVARAPEDGERGLGPHPNLPPETRFESVAKKDLVVSHDLPQQKVLRYLPWEASVCKRSTYMGVFV